MISTTGILVVLAIIVIIIIVVRAAASSDRIEQGEYISSTKKAYEQKLVKREKIRDEASTGELKFADRETTLSTVKSDGLLLEYVSEEYKDDREIVFAAIQVGMSLENEWAVGKSPRLNSFNNDTDSSYFMNIISFLTLY